MEYGHRNIAVYNVGNVGRTVTTTVFRLEGNRYQVNVKRTKTNKSQ
jgi:hypothetical protein